MAKPKIINMGALIGQGSPAVEQAPKITENVAASEREGKGIVIRFTYAQWRILKELSMETDTSIQQIAIGAIKDKISKDFGKFF